MDNFLEETNDFLSSVRNIATEVDRIAMHSENKPQQRERLTKIPMKLKRITRVICSIRIEITLTQRSSQ
jgi:hypothetical protein